MRKRAKVPTETDLSRIQQLSQEHDDENWKFRSWLKQYAPANIDGLVRTLSQKYFALIDCTQCANCCRSLHVEFEKSELHTIAKTLGQSIEEFQKQSMSEGTVNPPCPMLNGKLRSIYENRPGVCRSFPHLEQPEFTSRLIGVIDNVAVCPIAFNKQQLKEAFRWKGFDWYRNFTLALIAGLVIPYGVLSATDPARSTFDVKVAAVCFALGAACILLAANRVFVLSCALMVPAALMYYNALAAGDRMAREFCDVSFLIGFLVLILGTLAQSVWRARSSRDRQ